MAGGVCTKSLWCLALALLAGAGRYAWGQTPAGSLSGKLTDLHSRPLAKATVVIRNQATGEEVRATTSRGGAYRFESLQPGEYVLEASVASQGEGRLDGIVVVAGHEARVQAAIELAPARVAAAERAGLVRVDVARNASQVVTLVPAASSSSMHAEPPPPQPSAAALALAALRRNPELIPEIQQPHLAPQVVAKRDAEAKLALPARPLATVQFSAPLVAMPRAAAPQLASAGVRAGAFAARVAVVSVLAQIAPAVTIAASDPSLQTDFTIPQDEIGALPLTGRSWEAVVDVPAPVVPDDASDPAASHSMQAVPEITVDGASLHLAFGARSFGRSNRSSTSLIGPGATDSVLREVQAASGDEATPLRGIGSRANLTTRRGGDGFHGLASFFSRQNLWGAQDPFAQWVQPTSPATGTTVPVFTPKSYTPGDHESSWSASAGGRLHRRVFWFAAIDGNEHNDPGLATVKHPENFFAQPSNDQMQVLSARLGLAGADPVSAGLAAYSPMLQTLGGLLGPAARTSNQFTGFARFDWNVGLHNLFTLEGTNALLDASGGGLSRVAEPYGNHSFGSNNVSEQWLLARWQSTITQHLTMVTQAAFARHDVTRPAESPSPYEQSLNINAWGRLPQIVVDSRYGFTIGNPARFGPGSYPDERVYQGQEQIHWRHRSLDLKAGLDLSQNTDATSFLRNQAGTYVYSSVQNFVSDALSFASFGINGQLDPLNQHNCDQTGKVWRDTTGTLRGLGYLPCYSYYRQTIGPSDWWLRTVDWAGYATARWQAQKTLQLSLGLRWEREHLPPPIALLKNPDLPLTQKLPSLGNEFGPRFGLSWTKPASRLPVLHLGYGIYFGRTPNATLETALTQTGSPKGDLNFFFRPTDNLNAGGAPPFPYVLAGEPAARVKPGAVEFSANLRNGAAQQAVIELDETLPGRIHMNVSGVASLARKLPITLDANVDPAVNPQTITYAVVDGDRSGPLKGSQITVPFFASWPSSPALTGTAGRLNPNYQQILEVSSRANATYEAAVVRITRTNFLGLTLRARYTFAHAADWNPDESTSLTSPSVFDPSNLREDYGPSDLDVRQSASASVSWEPRWKPHDAAGRIGNGWSISGLASFRSGLPYTMRTSGSLAKEFDAAGDAIVALAPGMNGYGGDSRVYGVGRNTYRYPSSWKADMRLARRFNLGEMRKLEILAESFNLFNHRNVTELETTGYTIESGNAHGGLPTLNFLTGLKTGQTEFGQPLNVNATGFYRPRQFQFGLRYTF